ncbi:8247_t:CDS:2 [Entrophospora sp. SA101]|nr:8247_t:CDS:2 [Entrophospora sp. SA101]
METLQKYQNVEYQNRQKYRQRMERQYKIVKPQATQEEIDSAIDNDDAAKEALKEVQERHDDIKKIEKTIEERTKLNCKHKVKAEYSFTL